MTPKKLEKKFDRSYSKELFRIAQGDYQTAKVLLNAKNIRLENAFFIAQQSIEKLLKAVLVAKEVAVPMVHDIGALVGKLPSDLSPPFGYELSELNQYATIRRYEEGKCPPSTDELKEVLKINETLLNWAEKVLVDA